MDTKILEIAQRIKSLREILDISTEAMAKKTGVTPELYEKLENGEQDFSFTFLYKCAEMFNVDFTEIVSGENPHLSAFTVVRAGQGMPIKRRSGFEYFHLAARFKSKLAETLLVVAPYDANLVDSEIELSTHEGQEFNYILSGSLKFTIEGKVETLHTGDSVYYNARLGHGMVAIDGKDCSFLSVVIKG